MKISCYIKDASDNGTFIWEIKTTVPMPDSYVGISYFLFVQQSKLEGHPEPQLSVPQTKSPLQSLSESQSPNPSSHWFKLVQQLSSAWLDVHFLKEVSILKNYRYHSGRFFMKLTFYSNQNQRAILDHSCLFHKSNHHPCNHHRSHNHQILHHIDTRENNNLDSFELQSMLC